MHLVVVQPAQHQRQSCFGQAHLVGNVLAGCGHHVTHMRVVGDDHAELGEQGVVLLAVSDDQLVRSAAARSEEHTSELQSLMRISYAVFCLKKKKQNQIL